MTNINDVAEYAGVSASTVSRVLSGKSYVKEETKKKVMAAVRALEYTPNAMAKSLKMGRSDTIAIMIPSIQNLMFPDIVRGIEDTARRTGFTVVLCNTDEDVEIEKSYIAKLKTRLIDGFIVASMMPESEHILHLRNEGFPLVLTSRSYDKTIDSVVIDNVNAAFDAVSHLIRTGHKRIAIAMGRLKLPLYADRLKGYRMALERYGIPYDEDLVVHETNGTKSHYRLIRDLLDSGIKPDAIFATSDPKAIVVMRAVHDAGLSIPGDISVMGFDNVDISSMLEPPLSTVSQPLYEMGALAAKKLINQIRRKEETGHLPPPTVDVLATDLIIRKSTR